MAHRMSGPRAKIERAKEHVTNLDAAISQYREREPYVLVPEDEPQSGDRLYRLRIREEPPERVASIIGDVLQNARSALELLAWQLVDANGALPADEWARQRIGFPISERAEEFEANGMRKVEGASQEAKDLLRALKPYKGGNDALWRLHHLNRTDKHRLIGLVAGAFRSIAITMPPAGRLAEFARVLEVPVEDVPRITRWYKPANSSDRRFPLKDGDEVHRVKQAAREAQGDEHPQIAIDIALGQPGILEGEPVLDAMNEVVSASEETVELFARLF